MIFKITIYLNGLTHFIVEMMIFYWFLLNSMFVVCPGYAHCSRNRNKFKINTKFEAFRNCTTFEGWIIFLLFFEAKFKCDYQIAFNLQLLLLYLRYDISADFSVGDPFNLSCIIYVVKILKLHELDAGMCVHAPSKCLTLQ